MTGPTGKNEESVVEEAVRKFVHARSHGRQPDTDEFVRQYPELEHRLRQRIQNLERIDALLDSLVQADENDFEDEVTAITDNLVGRKIGGFEMVEMIGRGGMGVVYLARDTKLDRSVAIKSMPAKLADDSTARMRFHREARLLASLNHPNIAVIHEIVEEEDTGYLVLEYVPGQTLAQRIARKPLELKEALSIGEQIAKAVLAAHEKGVIHRDLKPRNIKIMPEGRVKVLDFGLAKPAAGQAASQDTVVTQVGSIIGTPAYMSPEQIRGDPIDQRTDIWSFGCVLYEMLTGKRPFEGKTVSDTVAHILERQPDWRALPQNTPANVKTLLRRCLEKESNQRLRDIADAVTEINETLSSPPLTIPLRLRRMAMIVGAVVIIIMLATAARLIPERQAQPSAKEIRLVILPFENLGPDEDEYFADSITNQITSYLAPIRNLYVLSPGTAMQYEKGKKNARQIGLDLGVDYILEGEVQRERPSDQTSPVGVMARLVKTSEDRLVSAPIHYVSKENLNELYRVEFDLAEGVAKALNVTLLEPARRALASRPTENTEALRFYLRGHEYFHRSYEEDDFEIAIRMYEEAVKLDPTFALAFSRLSMAHSWTYWFYDRSDTRLAEARQAVDKAFELSPDLPEAYLARGRYYYSLLDFESALDQLAIARESLPNNSEVLSNIGFCQRRQGRFEQALTNITRACEIDPLSSNMNAQVAATAMLLHKYADAERYYEQAISLRPDVAFPYYWQAGLYLIWKGDTRKAREVFERAPQNVLEDKWIVFMSIELNVLDKNYEEALDRLSSYEPEAFDTQFYFIPKAQLSGQIHSLMGNQQLARAPEDERFRSSLGITCAGLGRRQDAIREGELGVKLLPVSKDAWRGLYRLEDLARIYVMIGEFAAAIDQLDSLLFTPGEMSIPMLELDPAWDPLRERQDYKKLVEAGE
ncbi:MAG: protein kinase domain-containing protein [Planctomycetota bacterium]|jgi:Tfp pilus assembly protein PilF